MLFHCIRHAESQYNAEGRLQGHIDVPLSDLGRRQSESVASALARLPIEAVYSSPLFRAIQTAEPIARALGLEIRVEPLLIEIHAGIFQGHFRPDLLRLYPEEMARWRSGDPDYRIPGGESRRDLMRRGRAAFDALATRRHGQVVVVSHGGLLSGAIKALLELPAERNPFLLENGSISRLEITGEQVLLHSLNQVAHLGELGLAEGREL